MTDERIVHAIDCDLDDDCTCGAVDACETCGKPVDVMGGVHCCGQCATDCGRPEDDADAPGEAVLSVRRRHGGLAETGATSPVQDRGTGRRC